MKWGRLVGVILGVLVLGGCSTLGLPVAPPHEDAKAKLFLPIAGKAVLYVFRDESLVGADFTTTIEINKQAVATGARNRFNFFVLEPGSYSLSVRTTSQLRKPPVLPLNAETGKIYYAREVWTSARGFELFSEAPSKAKPIIRRGKLLVQAKR